MSAALYGFLSSFTRRSRRLTRLPFSFSFSASSSSLADCASSSFASPSSSESPALETFTATRKGLGSFVRVNPVNNSSIAYMGVSKHLLASIGNIDDVVVPNTFVPRGERVASLVWHGVVDSECDEMYHSLWTSVHNQTSNISLPFACRVLKVSDAAADLADAGEPFLSVEVNHDDVIEALRTGELTRAL